MVSGLREWLVWRRRDSAGNAVLQIARDVADRHRSVQGGLAEIRQPAVLDALTVEDFEGLDQVIAEQAPHDHEYAVVLARLTHAAARAKGFDEQVVDAALRLDTLLPGDDPSRERERLLREAYAIAQRDGYVRGGRIALGRLGQRALDEGASERARVLLHQQLELGDEEEDTVAEVDAALALGDLLRREGDRRGAQALFRRAGRSAQRLDHHRGIAEALVRQIELMPRETDLETLAALQRQASEAASRTADLGLQSRTILSLAETLRRNGKRDEAIAQLEHGLGIARQIGDLALEVRCLAALAEGERQRGRLAAAVDYERSLVDLEERLGNRPAASDWASRLGSSLLDLGSPAEAVEVFGRALSLAAAANDLKREQRALGGLGVAYSLVNRPGDAMQHLMRALDLARRTSDHRHEAQWLGSIGQALWRFDQPDDAIRALSEAVTLARRVDDPELEASLLALLGHVYAGRGQTPRARECYSRALELHRRLGQAEEQVGLLAGLAGLAAETGQVGSAIALCEQALQLATGAGDRVSVARLHAKLGRLAQHRRDAPLALDHLRKALAVAETLDQPALLGQILQQLATAQHAAGDRGAAATYLRALAHCRACGNAAGEALMALDLGVLLGTNGHREEALQLLREAATLAAGLGPSGVEIAQRTEAAIAAATDRERRPRETPPLRSARDVVARDDDRRAADTVSDETTLPPL